MTSAMRCLFRVVLLALPLFCSSALADGKVFASAVATSVTTPDQRAMLHFSNGVERLVIETSFVGEGTNFAWVIPLPSSPKIEAVSTNFFGYLNLAYQPKLILASPNWWILFLLLGYLFAASVWACRRNGPSRLIMWIGFVLLLFILLLTALPSFVRSGGAASVGTVNSVGVLNRQTVGIYDTATLAGSNGQVLLDWLNANGFQTPAAALPVISSYATQGWVFVAATIKRAGPAGGNSRPHPLSFTFQSEKPVYPLRLTGVENTYCTIELFVFGPERAEATGFQVEHCGKPFSIEVMPEEDFANRRELFAFPEPGEYIIGNPELRRFVLPATVTTKLVGTLTSQHMQTDAWIGWVPFRPSTPILYSRDAAAGSALNWIVGIVVMGLGLLQILSPRLKREIVSRGCLVVILLGAVCGWIRFSIAKTTEVKFTHGGWPVAVNNFRMLDSAIQQYALEKTNHGSLTEGELLQALNGYIKGGAKNTFEDQPLRCEPTPGNITLLTSTNGVEVFWHDYQSAPRQLATFSTK